MVTGTLPFVGADGSGGLSEETFSAFLLLFLSTFFIGSDGGFNVTGL